MQVCVSKASLQVAGLGPRYRALPRLSTWRIGGRVGKALSACSSPPFVEDFPGSMNSPMLLGVLALAVRAKGPPAASEQPQSSL